MVHRSALSALGLTPGADEREVRRAYARLLKQIDQERDPAGFQQLRETYERALQELASGEAANEEVAQSTDEKRSADKPFTPPDTPAEPPSMSAVHVFEAQFLTACRDADDAHKRLAACLADERLKGLEARELFEAHVVSVLARGWRPGHQFLWLAALEAFDWERDRGRLSRCHDGGEFLEAAIIERGFIKGMPEQHRITQRLLVHRLRDDAKPSERELLDSAQWIAWVSETIPHWLALNTRMSNLCRWQAWHAQALKRIAATVVEPEPAGPPDRPPWYLRINGYVLTLLSALFISGMLHLMTKDSPRREQTEAQRLWLRQFMEARQAAEAASAAGRDAPAHDKDTR